MHHANFALLFFLLEQTYLYLHAWRINKKPISGCANCLPSPYLDSVSNPTGLSADGSGAPSAPDASLGLLADRGNTPGNDDAAGIDPDDVDGDVADPGDGVSGDRPLGSLTGGDVGPRASSGGTNGSELPT
jgi:hypothetical protein